MTTTLAPQVKSNGHANLSQEALSAAKNGGSRFPASALRLLSGLGNITKTEEARKLDAKESMEFAKIKEEFSVWINSYDVSTAFDFGQHAEILYKDALLRVKGINFTQEDLFAFCISLAEFQEAHEFAPRAGLFLSALMNSSPRRQHTILTTHLSVLPDCLCYLNSNNVTVEGSVGSYFAASSGNKYTNESLGASYSEELIIPSVLVPLGIGAFIWNSVGSIYPMLIAAGVSASLVALILIKANKAQKFRIKQAMDTQNISLVKGSAGANACFEMQSGSVTIEKDAGTDAGAKLEGGELTINGNALGDLAKDAEGGTIRVKGNVLGSIIGKSYGIGLEIHVEGDMPRISLSFKSGKIFHKGRLVADRSIGY